MSELSGKKVLLVEDEAIIALSQSVILKAQACAVLVSRSGQEAVDAVRADPAIDMVLMDINLGPGMDGIEAARLILALRELPLIFLSGHTEKDIVEATEEITNYGYILKSAGETVLLASMKMAFRLFLATQTVRAQSRDLAQVNRELEEETAAVAFSEELFRTAFYSIGDAVISTDTAGMITRLNAVAEDLCGWTEAEARDRPLGEVFRIVDESSRAPAASPVERVLAEGAVVGLANHTVLLSRDGRERPIADSAAPILDSSRRLKGVVLVFRDQSEARAAQRALEESERHFRSFFELASVGIAQVNPDTGRFINCNDRLCALLGYSREELLGLSFSEVTAPEDRELDRRNFRAAAAGGGTYQAEKRYLRRDGSLIWGRVNAAFVRDGAGRAQRTIAVIEDISERKAAEGLRDEAFRHYEHAFDELLEGCQILDPGLRYVYVNRRAAIHGRMELGGLLGRTLLEVYPEVEGSELYALLMESLSTRRPSELRNHFIYPDGKDAWFDLSIKPVPEGILILSVDVSDTVRSAREVEARVAELEASRAETSLLADLVGRASQPIGLGYPDGRLGFVNQAFCELVGYSLEELRTMDWSKDLTPEEWREPEARVLAGLVATGKPVRFRKAYRRKDGSIVPVELKSEVVFGPDGGPEYFFSFVEDISARLASQEALEASLKEKEVLYLELQHRVKNSLALVSSVVSLEEMASEEAAVRDSLRNVRGRIEVLSSLYQLLGHDVRTEVDLSRYLGLICESLQSTYGRPGIRLDADLEPLVLDLKRATNLGLILNELVTNSFKYAFPGERAGKVEVGLHRKGGLAVLSVGDDGQGLPPGFDPQSSKGLGFQLVHELARQLSASLEGRGSLHVLSLPLGEP